MRALLASLVLTIVPALALPDGVTLCLYRLAGIEQVAAGCPCCRGHQRTPTAQSERDPSCCLHSPARDTFASSSEFRFERKLFERPRCEATEPLEPFFAIAESPRIDAFLRDELRHPPPLASRVLPLRL